MTILNYGDKREKHKMIFAMVPIDLFYIRVFLLIFKEEMLFINHFLNELQ